MSLNVQSNVQMLICYRNEDLAEMLENEEAGTNSAALLQTVVRAIIEL